MINPQPVVWLCLIAGAGGVADGKLSAVWEAFLASIVRAASPAPSCAALQVQRQLLPGLGRDKRLSQARQREGRLPAPGSRALEAQIRLCLARPVR